MSDPRIVCQFSCGAASAVATKLILGKYRKTREVCIINAFIEEEHEDNQRFLLECQRWFGEKIIQLRDEKYGSSAREVFKKKRYTKGLRGAPCSKALKKDILDAWRRQDDVMVLGYTAEERDRFDKFLDRNTQVECWAPLIEYELTKEDCLAMVENAGIALPAMYLLGYNNANCIGCVKGGQGYWNKIRVDFPPSFEDMAVIEETIGPSAYLFRDRKTNERYSLRDLDPNSGRFQDEQPISCSFFCEAAEKEFQH